jgi:hypothetical protein
VRVPERLRQQPPGCWPGVGQRRGRTTSASPRGRVRGPGQEGCGSSGTGEGPSWTSFARRSVERCRRALAVRVGSEAWYAPVDGFSPSRTIFIASTTSGGSSRSTRRPTTTMLISHEAAHRGADRFWTAAPPGTSGRRTNYRPPAAGSHSTLPVSSEYTAPTMRSLPVATRSESTGFAARSCSTTCTTLSRTALSRRSPGSCAD